MEAVIFEVLYCSWLLFYCQFKVVDAILVQQSFQPILEDFRFQGQVIYLEGTGLFFLLAGVIIDIEIAVSYRYYVLRQQQKKNGSVLDADI